MLFAGRLCVEKDPLTLLRAIRILRSGRADFVLRIAGDGPLRSECEAYVREHGLSDAVEFLGWVDRDGAPAEYRRAHVLVASSRVEAMSVGSLEWLLCGAYLVATSVSGHRDMLEAGGAGELFPVGDAEELARILSRLMDTRPLPAGDLPGLAARYAWSGIVSRLHDIVTSIPCAK